ncbi:MAG: hypothetical protein M5U28_12975 [Sandaracinaceae bacterium]|nr:hypothetical protein [Sandaracinaceae bacterium]
MPTSPPLDICDGRDNDCNPATPDGVDDAARGRACDDDDEDLCADGVLACVGGALVCSGEDGVDDDDLCNGVDDDCDPATADGSAEPTLGDPCDGGDADLCDEGEVVCTSGALRVQRYQRRHRGDVQPHGRRLRRRHRRGGLHLRVPLGDLRWARLPVLQRDGQLDDGAGAAAPRASISWSSARARSTTSCRARPTRSSTTTGGSARRAPCRPRPTARS